MHLLRFSSSLSVPTAKHKNAMKKRDTKHSKAKQSSRAEAHQDTRLKEELLKPSGLREHPPAHLYARRTSKKAPRRSARSHLPRGAIRVSLRLVLFSDWADEDLARLAKVVSLKRYPKNTCIIQQHTNTDHMYLLVSGRCMRSPAPSNSHPPRALLLTAVLPWLACGSDRSRAQEDGSLAKPSGQARIRARQRLRVAR